MNNLKDILAKIEQGSSWVSYDKISGTGPDKVAIKVEHGTFVSSTVGLYCFLLQPFITKPPLQFRYPRRYHRR